MQPEKTIKRQKEHKIGRSNELNQTRRWSDTPLRPKKITIQFKHRHKPLSRQIFDRIQLIKIDQRTPSKLTLPGIEVIYLF